MLRRPGRIGATVLVVILAGGCAGSSRTDDDYRHKVANTAETLDGVLGTVQVALKVSSRAPAAYLSVTFADADDDASATAGNFDAIQPPSAAADQLRGRLDAVMQDTVSMLDDLRVAARRNRGTELAGLATPLPRLQARLQQLEGVAG
ncbi:MAG: hypothetical protein QOF39_1208 [Frankiales bacterium]|jgi:hypothetical protein|nr:hypothetical protein [Frankiales bacterium]